MKKLIEGLGNYGYLTKCDRISTISYHIIFIQKSIFGKLMHNSNLPFISSRKVKRFANEYGEIP